MPIRVGLPVPDFSAKAYLASEDEFKQVSLSDFSGRWLCLFFYPMDFSFVCPTELTAFAESAKGFEERNCDVVGCSGDTHLVHKAWCDNTRELAGLNFPLLADVTKRIGLSFGVLSTEQGIFLRGTFLIDPHGVLRWMCVNDLYVGRSVDEVLRNLDALQTNELCPCNWKKGEQTMTP